MKSYIVSITDCYGLTGQMQCKANSKNEARKIAREYIRAWQIGPATINYINEI
jgi:uncharacterized phage-associated protein